MIYSFATSDQPGYKYLHFFKEEDQAAAASFLKEMKPTRNDELKAFNIEISQWDENDNNPERWFKIKDLFFIGKNFKEYRFL
ncbi:6902_t:CDS:2 [Cetraspora pellucida]|uniref:6902_t:CDS:1 n=1 Tax=Cetraspora pellucida TaxID=1433469 RepID=A0A9N8YY56_9GLOM|nr:6902_t:CDS:2 [Cetraspora pellucida]